MVKNFRGAFLATWSNGSHTGYTPWIYAPISTIGLRMFSLSIYWSSGTHWTESPMLVIVEEGMQVLSGSSFITECTLLHQMYQDLSQHLCLLLYGVNYCTVLPVELYPCMQDYFGSRGRPKLIVNVDAVELLKSCGYTWNEVAGTL